MIENDEQTSNDDDTVVACDSSDTALPRPKHATSSLAYSSDEEESPSSSVDGDSFDGVLRDLSFDYQENQEHELICADGSSDAANGTKKSKRQKTTLLIALFIVLVAISGLCFGGYNLLFNSNSGNAAVTSGADGNALKIKDATDEAANLNLVLPKLTELFGLTTDEALARLGSGYLLVSTTQATAGNASGGAVVDANAVAQIVEIDYKATTAKTTVSNLPKVYLSLNASGRVVECYLTSALNVLGYTPVTFSALVATSTALDTTLKAVGIGASNYVYTVPTVQSYTMYAKDSSGNPTNTVAKESAIFNGITDNQTVSPKTWSVTLEYDYTMFNVTNDSSKLSRMIYIKLV